MFFVLSKILWFVLSPFNLALFALTGAMIALRMRLPLLARRLGLIAWVILIVFAVLPTGPMLTAALEARYAVPETMPRRVDGIIMLGGAIDSTVGTSRGAPQMADAADRIAALADLARRYPYARLVYTSGLGNLKQRGVPEAQMAEEALALYGLRPGRRLVLEDASRTTWENAVNTQALLEPRDGQAWLLVTSAWHMPRAMGAFRAAGWPDGSIMPYPTDYLTPANGAGQGTETGFLGNIVMAQRAMREIVGILAYGLTGRWQGNAP